MSDTFIRDKFAWLDQVADDHSLPPSAFRVAYELSRHVHREKGYAWPSQAKLAADLGMAERHVRRLVEAIIERAHLAVERGPNRRASNHYRLVLKPTSATEQPDLFERTPESGRNPVSTGHGSPDKKSSTGHSGSFERTPKSGSRGLRSPPTPLIESFEETIDGESHSPPSDFSLSASDAKATSPSPDATVFEEFWQAYHLRRVGKESARKAFAAALKEALPDEIIAGAKAYMSERARVADPAARRTYTAHPTTWLNAKRWLDEGPTRLAGGLTIDQAGNEIVEEDEAPAPVLSRADARRAADDAHLRAVFGSPDDDDDDESDGDDIAAGRR